VAFDVDNVDTVFNKAVQAGAKVVKEPHTIKDEFGTARLAAVRTYGDTIHTLVERADYTGAFLPGYRSSSVSDPIAAVLPEVKLEAIDHCVGNQDWDQMEKICQ
jgi:4-hydroxyphenylpyruvate dioxygenase